MSVAFHTAHVLCLCGGGSHAIQDVSVGLKGFFYIKKFRPHVYTVFYGAGPSL